MKIAITGASGLVGLHLTRQFSPTHEVQALSHHALDITNAHAVAEFFQREQPELVLNCAVIDVDRCEREPALAEAVNVNGPRWLAEATARYGGTVVHFSTNYVFDGRTPGHVYTQADEPQPINVYGQTKLAGERAVMAANPRHFIVRTSWVFGQGKASFLATVAEKLHAGERVRAITDAWASVTYAPDLTARVAQLLPLARYGVYHVVNEGVCSYHEFASAAAAQLGAASALIETVSEADASRLAARPRYTPMRCLLTDELGLRPLRPWSEALAASLKQTGLS